ncbi:MAG: Gfo/Idh/MocA family oxidoreductase, partial [Acidobacteriia bacterium]|nr:Gfo/Idh/MocA family oxidoreductase [Terriglobia bacterium]
MSADPKQKAEKTTRRDILKTAAVGFPMIVPSYLFGQSAPSNLIQVGQIGCGRIFRASEFPGVMRHSDKARFVAVADLDTVRIADARQNIEAGYTRSVGAGKFAPVKTYRDYREMLADKSIDAVCISTPDHWHAQPAMEAALAGKDVYLQKPASLTIREGRQMADAVKKSGRILQIGSQQRSAFPFRFACELVRNGRIGKLKEVYIGLPVDPPGGNEKEMPAPQNLNYDFWLGSTPLVYYTQDRVHPQAANLPQRYDRPGWLRCDQFGAGMITGWGAHHVDTAHVGMDAESTGPLTIQALAEFPRKGSGLWDVHGSFHVRADYAGGVAMYISDFYPNGVKFVGEEGWIWVTRGNYRLGDSAEGRPRSNVLDASDLRILRNGIKDGEIRLHASPNDDHHLDWLTSIKTRQEPVTSAEAGHRAC